MHLSELLVQLENLLGFVGPTTVLLTVIIVLSRRLSLQPELLAQIP